MQHLLPRSRPRCAAGLGVLQCTTQMRSAATSTWPYSQPARSDGLPRGHLHRYYVGIPAVHRDWHGGACYIFRLRA